MSEPAFRGELIPVEEFTESVRDCMNDYMTREHDSGFYWEVRSWDAPFFHPPAGRDVVQVYARQTDRCIPEPSNEEQIAAHLEEIKRCIDNEASAGVTMEFDCPSCEQKGSKESPAGPCWQCEENSRFYYWSRKYPSATVKDNWRAWMKS